MGPFFQWMGEGLRRRGHGVWKVNFNGGDEQFWQLPNGISYTGTMEEWPQTLRTILKQHEITDVLLFGDCRQQHRVATALCAELHIPVHVFEEGYIRPDWVTLELGGVNGHSTLPRNPDWYRRTAARLPPPPPHMKVPSSFRRRAWEGVVYNTATILGKRRYPHTLNHRPWPPLVEGVGWLRRLARRGKARKRSARLLKELQGREYMLFPLQLDADAQVRLHSPFSDLRQAIRLVIASFANHAPAEQLLVIKEHPLDNGVRNWRKYVARIAAECGVAERVRYMEVGDIALVVQAARGLVTINSTTGTLALASGVPVITLGHAVYDMAGITYQGSLNTFWNAPPPPDEETFGAFRRVLIERCLIPGGFFSDAGLSKLVNAALVRLEKHCPFTFAAKSQRQMAQREAGE
ncbi:capsular biosynthesis protein [Oecophyllibacter saccharovorans]|uniref:capsule biosynthesis protein n=1 Tax=Oecophyllibacter saccharovorans TaxID=2558360 RepID=UPI00114402F6|nr:capsular biosynthesis protein [Oecophyllibacter saccharovorans]QDH16074.1 capsular biosynthesis protein [Oecophyllibacter saccharovorans]